MHRNTYILVIVLAILAFMVTAVNLFGGNDSPTQAQNTQQRKQLSPDSQPSLAQAPQWLTYQSTACGIKLQYPDTFTKVDIETGGATFIDSADPDNSIVVLCQEDIPRVPLTENLIEDMQIGTTSAQMYHDTSQEDGSPVDKLIFTHPESGLDVYVAGFGETFTSMIQSIQLLN